MSSRPKRGGWLYACVLIASAAAIVALVFGPSRTPLFLTALLGLGLLGARFQAWTGWLPNDDGVEDTATRLNQAAVGIRSWLRWSAVAIVPWFNSAGTVRSWLCSSVSTIVPRFNSVWRQPAGSRLSSTPSLSGSDGGGTI